MDTPKYSATVVVGGSAQTTQFRDAFPAPTGFDDDVIITKQSGELAITFNDPAGNPFDVSGLSSTEAFVVPYNSDVTAVSLGSGVISGAGNNVYTITWTKDTIPDEWSSFPQDNGGSIVLYVQLDEAGDDYFQAFTRFNIDDGDFKGDAQTVPLIVFDYSWTTAIASEWAKYDRGTPLTLTDAAAFLAAAGKTDWGHVVDKDLTTSPAGVDNEQYILAGIGGDWSTASIGDVARYSATDTVWYFKTPIEGDEVYVTDENTRYRYDGAAWSAVAAGDMTKAVYDPTNVNGDAFLRSNMSGTQTASTISDFDTEVSNNTDVTANTAKVTNATHTGDVTGSGALTLESVAITGQTTETAVSGDFLLMSDTSDSGNLKKVDALDFLSGGGGGGAGIAANWAFDTDTTATDPTAGGIKYNNATPASVTAIYVNTEANNTADFEALISALGSGDTLYLQQLDDDADYIVFNVTSSVDNTGWYTINGTIADSGTLPANASDVGVNFSYTSGGAGASVTSVFTRTGAVMAAASDYDASQVDNDSGVAGTFVSNALDTLDTASTPSVIAAGTDNNQTGTTYTLVLTDADNKTVYMDNAAANTLTIPTNASVAFDIGTKINVMMEGAGTTTIDGDTGVTVNGVSGGAVAINTQNQGATLQKRDTNTWMVTGDIGTSGEAFNGFKENLIIDGQFNHWDEGAGPFTAAGNMATMWRVSNVGNGGTGFSRSSFTLGQSDVPYGPKYFVSSNNDASSTGVNLSNRMNILEESSGRTVTLSLYMRAASGSGDVGLRTVQNFGSGGSPSSSVTDLNTTVTPTGTWTKFTETVTLSSISGKTLGSNLDSRLTISVDQKISSGTFEGTLEIANISLVYGSVSYDQAFPTPAEERHKIDEYYQIIGDYDEGVAGADLLQMYPTQAGTPATARQATIPLRRKMRAAPTVTLGTPSAGTLDSSTATTTAVIVTGTASGTSADQKFDYIELDARL